MRCLLLLALLAATAAAQDTDGDGLSDFHERHKYFTDPLEADTDGDGTPDGDWNERREHAYTVRTIVQVMRPADAICDDYQDARLLDGTDRHVEIEVIHYPLNTVADALAGVRDWRTRPDRPEEFLASTTTSNWDAELRAELLAELRAEGIEPDALDDRTFVERTAALLMNRARPGSDFTTFFTHFPDGAPAIVPGLEDEVARYAPGDLGLEERWQRDLFAKGMFENRTHGSCTSTSIYLQGCLRAVGIPTRTILCIPVVDASDPRELGMVRRLRHHRVRRTVLGALAPLRDSWTSHTFNEVWVGGRWRRLNYACLGQNILDPRCLGLMTHVGTVRDWADAGAAETVGRRQAGGDYDDVFGHRNPYSALTVSDRFGVHARIANELPPELDRLTIERALWYDSPERPASLEMRLRDPGTAGHVLLKVKEGRPEDGPDQYEPFWNGVDRRFVLRAEGHPDVAVAAARGYWASGWFYLRIEPADLATMARGVAYRLVPLGEGDYRWAVDDGVRLERPRAAAAEAAREEARDGDLFASLTIDALLWTDAPDAPGVAREMHRQGGFGLLGRVGEWDGWDEMKRFTATADGTFFLEADGHPPIELHTGVGGVTTTDARYVFFRFRERERALLAPGVAYRLRPRNANDAHRWVVRDGLAVTRPAR